MAAFEYRQAQEIRDAFERHGCRYLFIGKSGAILLGFPDTTQDADLFVERSAENGRNVVAALKGLGFRLTDAQAGIERFSDAWLRHINVEGFPVCHPDDIIASKEAANRSKDRESLPRLRSFRDYWLRNQQSGRDRGMNSR